LYTTHDIVHISILITAAHTRDNRCLLLNAAATTTTGTTNRYRDPLRFCTSGRGTIEVIISRTAAVAAAACFVSFTTTTARRRPLQRWRSKEECLGVDFFIIIIITLPSSFESLDVLNDK
jgi:hypothetical protein